MRCCSVRWTVVHAWSESQNCEFEQPLYIDILREEWKSRMINKASCMYGITDLVGRPTSTWQSDNVTFRQTLSKTLNPQRATGRDSNSYPDFIHIWLVQLGAAVIQARRGIYWLRRIKADLWEGLRHASASGPATAWTSSVSSCICVIISEEMEFCGCFFATWSESEYCSCTQN